MILNPKILALVLVSLSTAGMTGYAGFWGVQILRYWDLRSGTENQLRLERKTYLVSTLLSYALTFQLLSLFLFVYTADALCSQFSGAMCAAGTLAVNGYGYPVLLLKLLNFLLAGLWLILNAADNRASDYPLIRTKYGFLAAITPLFAAEAVLQWLYFHGLVPDVITSCCGTLFGSGQRSLVSDLAAAPIRPAQIAFFSVLGATVALGAVSFRRSRWRGLFSALSVLSFAVGVVGILSFLSIYVYELPTHHCPFCLLQAEYGFVGYPLYVALLGAAVTGAGVGVLSWCRRVPSLARVIPAFQRQLTLTTVLLLLAVLAVAGWAILSTDFRP